MSTSKVIGIDLGTGFSAVSFMEGGEPKIIANAEGQRTTPSIVAWTKTGERLVGQAAKRQAVSNPKNTVYEVKRLIGRKFDEVQDEIKKLPYTVVRAANGDCRIKINDKEYSPEEISSFILAKLKADAEAFLGETVTDAVITVPAYFNDSQRQATKDAGKIAGLNVLRIVNEPTAASLAYGLGSKKSGYIGVADIGAGTSDFTILEVGDGVFEVKATSGDSQLGGKDFDNAIMDWVIDEFRKSEGIDLSKDSMAVQRIKDDAEKAKIELSTAAQYEINLPFITADANGPKHLQMTLTRAKFEAIVSNLIDRLGPPARQCISEANIEKLDDVILVGGSTRMPAIQAKIKEVFGLEPSKNINPDECVSLGATIQGGVISGDVKDVLLLDVTPLDICIETLGGIATPMIERNTTIPTKKSQVFSTASDNQPAITVRICQGNRKMFNDNKLLGQFNLDGIPPAPRGIPQEEITVDIDANGIINVTAKDLGTGKDAHITITASSGLSKEEIERAKADAEKYADEDKKRADLITAKNNAEAMCFQLEKQMKDNHEKINDDALESDINSKIADVREAIKTNDKDKIDNAVKSLSEAAQKIGEKIYAGTGGNAPNFSAEDLEKMKNDPRFAEMFKNGGPFGGTPPPENNSSPTDEPINGGTV